MRGEPVRVTVTARCRLDRGLRAYAEEKLERLGRHVSQLHEVRLTLDGDQRHIPAFRAEAVVHLQHTQVAARVEGGSQREAVDRLVDKLDRLILRRKERVTAHKGRAPAGADPAEPRARRAEVNGTPGPPSGAGAGGLAAIPRRRVRLRPMSMEDAIEEFSARADASFIYLDEDGGQVCVLTRRRNGDLELVIADLG